MDGCPNAGICVHERLAPNDPRLINMAPTTKKSKTSTSAPAGAADAAAERLRLEKAREGGWSDLPGSVHGWIVEAIDEYKQGAGTGRAGKGARR